MVHKITLKLFRKTIFAYECFHVYIFKCFNRAYTYTQVPRREKREMREKETANVAVFTEGKSCRGFIGVFVVPYYCNFSLHFKLFLCKSYKN